MKILFLTYTYWPPDFGGELLISIERFESLAQRGHKITVLTSGRPGFPSAENRNGLRVLRSPVVGSSRPARLLRHPVFWVWACLKLLKLDFEVLHLLSMPGVGPATGALAAWSFCRLAHRRKARTITVHALADSEQAVLDLNGWQRIWKNIHLRQMDRIVAVSPALYGPLKAYMPSKATLLVNGVRNDVFKPLVERERDCFRQEQGLPPEAVVFTFLGSVGRRKGFDLLAAAFAELAPAHPNWRLWVIGPRTRRESQNLDLQEAEAVTQPLKGLESQVKFWGRIDDRLKLAMLLGASDVFVFPSRREGMGLAPIEAMAAGTPVIIARIPDVTDLANVEGVTGLYFPPGDTRALVQAMLTLGEDRSLRQQMGRAAVERVRQAFGWEEHVSKWERLYTDGAPCGSDREHERTLGSV